ncbi:MAG: rubrerythrin family protein [Bacteroidales bacterium]|jgi:rubrerythrin|nr:rubrerythrin family protein [Bacteroidales bacterium]
MEKSIKGTQTEKNLLKAFAGESQAKNRYTFFAKIARKDGFEQIAAIFEETALQEETHAKQFFKFLEGGDVEITAIYPAGILATTAENLKAAANGEYEEWSALYPEFARIAGEEGFSAVAVKFKAIAKVEAEHERRYRKLLQNMEKNEVFRKEKKVKWVCRKCGFVHESQNAPQKCPACDHPQSYFEEMAENY